jgi:REP-associated tyrosine transposase
MYEYRDMSPAERSAALADRKQRGFPWHGPPHLATAEGFRIVTGVCDEHRKILNTSARLAWFESELLKCLQQQSAEIAA